MQGGRGKWVRDNMSKQSKMSGPLPVCTQLLLLCGEVIEADCKGYYDGMLGDIWRQREYADINNIYIHRTYYHIQILNQI